MEIKKLTKEEQSEGLTLDLVNAVNLKKRTSPVMFKKGDEPVNLMACSKGYWVNTSDGFLKDSENNLLVFKERECQIARARYLFYHADDEKKKDAEKLLESRKKKIQEKLDIFKKNIETIEAYTNENSQTAQLVRILESVITAEQKEFIRLENERKVALLPKMKKEYEMLVAEFERENYNYLLNVMGIEKIENPVSFKFDNEKDMRVLKNSFGAKAIEEADGDVNKLFARMKIEQQSNI